MEQITPRGHQNDALSGLKSALSQESRAQCLMCCGSGKTYTQAFLAQDVIANAENPNDVTIVCLVPNRELVRQNAWNYRKVLGDDVAMMGMCSDGEKTENTDVGATEIDMTTKPDALRSFVQTPGPRVIFSTYQSQENLIAGLTDTSGAQTPVQLINFDEAHRTAEKSRDSLFALCLSDAHLKADKRAFFTATPRIGGGAEKNNDLVSMSDPDTYGPVAYTYPFSRGVQDGLVTDYDLWVPIIEKSELNDFMTKNAMSESDQRTAMSILALEKIMQDTGQDRFLAFHKRTDSSRRFAGYLEERLGPQGFNIAHIDGTMPSRDRVEALDKLSEGKTVLSNCKAFVEGVDVPGLQGAIFVDPKGSVVDIVQAIGRVSRRDPNDDTKRASVVAPILVDSKDPGEIEKKGSMQGFETLMTIAEALRANDDAFSRDISEQSRAFGRSGRMPTQKMQKLRVTSVGNSPSPELSADLLDQMSGAVSMASLTRLQDPFAVKVGEYERHVAEHGGPPTTQTNKHLTQWMTTVRRRHAEGRLEPEHAEMLDSVRSWSWIGPRAKPAQISAHLQAFYTRARRGPSLAAKVESERELADLLHSADNAFIGKPQDKKTRSLSETLFHDGHLFRSKNVDAQVSGRIRIADREDGKKAVFFSPHALHEESPGKKRMPYFQTGITGPAKEIELQMDRQYIDRFRALPKNHSLTIQLGRAGVRKNPFFDGHIDAWVSGFANHGETPETSKASLKWVLSRLKDGKIAGDPPFTQASLETGALDADAPARRLNHNAPKGTNREVVDLVGRLQLKAAQGALEDKHLSTLDACPGFAYVEPERAGGRVASAAHGLATRHGRDILSDPDARMGDNGLANTLRNLDTIVSKKQRDPDLKQEFDMLARAGLLVPLKAGQKAREAPSPQSRRERRTPDEWVQ